MPRLMFISDFTEQFAYKLLKGIMRYSRDTEPWVVQKLSPYLKNQIGLRELVNLSKKWNANVVIGQFETDDDLSLFASNNIVVFAQDYKQKIIGYPSITGEDIKIGTIAADYYIEKGFKKFAFFGYKDVCWSNDRYIGFKKRVEEAGFGNSLYLYNSLDMDSPWIYNSEIVAQWLKSLPTPMAVFACDDNQAAALIEIGNACGVRVPYDISVLGVDDDEILCNLCYPSLSSIKVDIEAGGYNVAMQATQMSYAGTLCGPDILLNPIGVISRSSTSPFATSDIIVIKTLNYIRENIYKRINVMDVLKAIPLSRRMLETRFKNVTGTSIYNYISLQRINLFASLLTTTKDTIAEISYKMDEMDSKSISRRFKDIMGLTPSEYRDSHCANCGY